MTLTDRLSASFLGALALILIGFSAALYALTSASLNRAVDVRLDSALNTLGVLVEDEPGGLIWEGEDRRVSLGQEPGHDHVRYLIRDEQGIEIDRSKNLTDPSILLAPGTRQLDRRDEPWRVVELHLKSTRTGPPEPGEQVLPTSLILTAGLPLEPVERPLRNLAVTLPVLSVSLWILTALLGRRLCRTALAPLTRMASTARSLGVDDPWRRLPVAETVDELYDLARSFNGLLDRWHHALDVQSRFAGDASHQLRNPLAALIGQVDVALRRDRSPDEYRETLRRVREQSDRLRRIVDALLYLARADAEAASPDLEALNLSDWCRDHLRRRVEEGTLDAGSVVLKEDISASIRVQSALMGEVLDNLLDNALAHGRSPEPVHIRIRLESGWVTLTVEDQGRGVHPEELARIFDPFYRSAEARRLVPGGSGLGLAVARRILTAFGGSLVATSGLGQGTRFVLSLPTTETLTTDPKNDHVANEHLQSAPNPSSVDPARSIGPSPTN